MSDERRERYAAAMWAPVNPGHLNEEAWIITEAAMAVADEEIGRAAYVAERVNHALREENARLRTELDSAKRHIDARRIELLHVNERHQEELEDQRAGYRRVADSAAKSLRTIERATEVLDEWYGTSDASALSAEIRTALEGDKT